MDNETHLFEVVSRYRTGSTGKRRVFAKSARDACKQVEREWKRDIAGLTRGEVRLITGGKPSFSATRVY